MASLLTCFAGGFLVAPLCGEPVLETIGDPLRLAVFTLLWYLMFYTPGDLVYNSSKIKPVKIGLYALKGLYYPKKIVAGIKHAKHVFHGNAIAYIVIATLKANGSGFIKPVTRLIRGATEDISGCLESMKPSVTTKYCFLCSLIYVLWPHDLIYILMTAVLVTMKVGPLFSVPVDLFKPVEDKVCPLLFEKRESVEKKQD